MRITHVIPGLTHERGGPPAVLQALADHQAAAGHAVTVLTTDQGLRHGEHAVELSPRVRLERAAVRGPDRIAYAPGFGPLVRRHLGETDVLHVHSVFTYPVHVALREAGRAGAKVVLRPCGVLHRIRLGRSRWQKSAYLALWGGLVRRVCAAWHYTSANESAESWPWDDSPRFVLEPGLEPDRFALDRAEARRRVARRWPQLGEGPYVLFLSRLHPLKRPDLLVEAFLAAAPPEYRLAVAGPDEGGTWARLAGRLLRDPAAARRVVPLGTVLGDDKAALLSGARLFALPSEHENFGVAVLEALGAGTPVLASPHVDVAAAAAADGMAETVALEVGCWRERLAAVLAAPAVPEGFSERARGWVRANYSWDRITADLVERYRWVVASCPAEPLIEARP